MVTEATDTSAADQISDAQSALTSQSRQNPADSDPTPGPFTRLNNTFKVHVEERV